MGVTFSANHSNTTHFNHYTKKKGRKSILVVVDKTDYLGATKVNVSCYNAALKMHRQALKNHRLANVCLDTMVTGLIGLKVKN